MDMQHVKQLYVGGVESAGAQLAAYIDSKHPELATFLKTFDVQPNATFSDLVKLLVDAGHNSALNDSIRYLNKLDNFSGAAEMMAFWVAFKTLRNDYKSLLGD